VLIESIELTNFKNYERSSATFSSGFNIITGNNGQGKTNMLDGIYLLCMTKSYFQYSEKNLVRFDEDFFRIDGYFSRKGTRNRVVCKYKLPGSKSISIDDKDVKKYSSVIGRFPAVIIAPGDINLIEEGSEERRKYLDIAICQGNSSYLEELNKYNKLLKQRNSLLKKINSEQRNQDELLDFFNEEMAIISVSVQSARKKFAEEIEEGYNDIYNKISGGNEAVSFKYLPDCDGDKDAFIRLYQQNLKKDIILERTTHGIHKDDIEFMLEGQPVKRVGSQGQIKSTIFAAKLSQYNWIKKAAGTKPILLLDDIFDKLDHLRVTSLLKLLDSEEYGQVFITDTYSERITSIIPQLQKNFASFQINKGNILTHGK